MYRITDGLSRAINYMMTIRISDFIDIAIVACLIYYAIQFIRKTNSHNLARGLIFLLLMLGVSGALQLTVVNFLLRRTVELGLIALIILFQPELRRLLERMGSGFASGKSAAGTVMDSAITQTVLACSDMSASKTGALIIFERNVNLNAVMSTGTIINADATAELIKNIFFNKAPLHDGALIIREGRLAAAGCVLPLTQRANLSKELGTRHRAGIGMSEHSDAIVIIVSEESGAISVSIDGMFKRHLSAQTLDELLRHELIKEDDADSKKNISYIVKKFFKVDSHEQQG